MSGAHVFRHPHGCAIVVVGGRPAQRETGFRQDKMVIGARTGEPEHTPPAGSRADGAARHDRAVAGYVQALQHLLAAPDPQAAGDCALGAVGAACAVDRCYACQLDGPAAAPRLRRLFGWHAPDAAPLPALPDPVCHQLLASWAPRLAAGEVIQARQATMSAAELAAFAPREVGAVLVLPIVVEAGWWGVVALEDHRADRVWDEQELPVLQLFATGFGLVMLRRQVEARQTELAAERGRLLARLQRIVERMPTACIVFDREWRCEEWNPAAELVFGFRRSEMLGRDPADWIVPPQHRQHTHALRARLTDASSTALSVNENLTADGGTVTCEWYVTTLPDTDGEPAGYVAMVKDVTEHLALQAAERAASERLSTVIAASPVPVVALDREARVTVWNTAAERLFGWPASAVLGQGVPVVPAYGWPLFEQMHAALLRDEAVPSVVVHPRCRDGREVEALLSVAPLRDGRGAVLGVIAQFQDLTELRRNEDALRCTEALYRSVVEQQGEMVCRFGPDLRLRFANEAFCRGFGLTCAELVGRDVSELAAPARRELARRRLQAVLATPRIEITEAPTPLPDGTVAWRRWTTSPVLGPDREVVELQSVGHDITADSLLEALLVRGAPADGPARGGGQGRALVVEPDDAHRAKVALALDALGWTSVYLPSAHAALAFVAGEAEPCQLLVLAASDLREVEHELVARFRQCCPGDHVLYLCGLTDVSRPGFRPHDRVLRKPFLALSLAREVWRLTVAREP